MRTLYWILSLGLLSASSGFSADRKIVLVAGSRSHGSGEHEFRAGCLLLEKCLQKVPGVTTVVYSNGWPDQPEAFDGAAAILIYSDGGDGHPAIQGNRLKILGDLMAKGVGLGCAHYAVEVPKEKGGPEFLKWIGGYFETYRSVNPHWEGSFTRFPRHPITRGVKPFTIRDEWYYHMRFPDGMKNVKPILTALPPDETRGRPGTNDPHGGNPEVQQHQGEFEHVMWAIERPDGGRGFGFTGGHFHKNWGNENFRKTILNAILWIAKIDVPRNGVASSLSADDLKQNLDDKSEKKK
jgi:type 1 glutamine amidotransferase